MNKIAFIIIASVALSACGKGHSNNIFRAAATAKKAPELQDSFKGACESAHQGWFKNLLKLNTESRYPRSSRSEISFKGDAITIKEVHYFGADCDGGEAYAFAEKGSYSVGDKDKNEKNNGGRFLDITMNRVDASMASEEGAIFASKYNLCGMSDWKAGDRSRDVTAQAGDSNCFGVTPKRTIANIYQVDNSKLMLGYTGDGAVSAEERPTTIDTKAVFTR